VAAGVDVAASRSTVAAQERRPPLMIELKLLELHPSCFDCFFI